MTLARFLDRFRRIVLLAAPWLGLLVLNALFELPGVLDRVYASPLLLLRPSGELLVLTTIYCASERLPRLVRTLVRVPAMIAFFLLYAYAWDDAIVRRFLQETPLLYDQQFLARHLWVLIGDIWSWTVGLILFGSVVGVVVLVLFTHAVLGQIGRPWARVPLRFAVPATALAWAAVIAFGLEPSKKPGSVSVHWVVPGLVTNIEASIEMHEAIRRRIGDSPYAHYDRDIVLAHKPDVQLFLVESYGRLAAVDENTQQPWKARLAFMEQSLKDDGWHMVSGFSAAPVSGGRSWLAEATVLTGTRVRYEAVFRHLSEEFDRVPNLVAFLRRQGYETILLAPADRERRGLVMTNPYGYDHTVRHDDLGYTGRPIGWGIIPDQYSLGFTDEHVWSRAKGPIFTNFHMVSSHAPWEVVPIVVDDWRSLNGQSERKSDDFQKEEDLGELFLHMRRYRRVEPRFTYMGELDSLKSKNYWRTVEYDLELIERYLSARRGDALVIVMGDHQPPFITDVDGSYDVPVHVFATNPDVLFEWRAAGFTDGLVMDPDEHPAILHEGLFSLVIRSLVRCCAQEGTPLPEVDFDGVQY